MELRYMGFDQKQNTRTYKFDGVANGQPTVHFVVTADLALFLANRIGIQEGPTLCAHKLSSAAGTCHRYQCRIDQRRSARSRQRALHGGSPQSRSAPYGSPPPSPRPAV